MFRVAARFYRHLQLLLQSAHRPTGVLPGRDVLPRFPHHNDLRGTGMVPLLALCDCTQRCRGAANLDHRRQRDSNRARIALGLGPLASTQRGRPGYDLGRSACPRPWRVLDLRILCGISYDLFLCGRFETPHPRTTFSSQLTSTLLGRCPK